MTVEEDVQKIMKIYKIDRKSAEMVYSHRGPSAIPSENQIIQPYVENQPKETSPITDQKISIQLADNVYMKSDKTQTSTPVVESSISGSATAPLSQEDLMALTENYTEKTTPLVVKKEKTEEELALEELEKALK